MTSPVLQHHCAVQRLATLLFTGQKNFPLQTELSTIAPQSVESGSGSCSAAQSRKELTMLFLLAWFFLWVAFCCDAFRDIAVARAAGGLRRWRRTLSTPLSVQRQVSDLRKGNIPLIIQLCLLGHQMSRTMTCLHAHIPMLVMLQWTMTCSVESFPSLKLKAAVWSDRQKQPKL